MDILSCTKVIRVRWYDYSIHICYPSLGQAVTSKLPYRLQEEHGVREIVLGPSTVTLLSAISNHQSGYSTYSGDPV